MTKLKCKKRKNPFYESLEGLTLELSRQGLRNFSSTNEITLDQHLTYFCTEKKTWQYWSDPRLNQSRVLMVLYFSFDFD